MRKVAKDFDDKTVRSKLAACAKGKAEELETQRDNKAWNNSCWRSCEADLSVLYHNKCAYCEQKIVVKRESTIEHYRPKSDYYWLAYEWSNLFIACNTCNGKKGDKFEVNKRWAPICPTHPDGTLEVFKCYANHPDLLAEEPLWLHPELDDPNEYFEFGVKGDVIAKKKLSAYHRSRVEKMKLLIDTDAIQYERKVAIDMYLRDFELAIETIAEYYSSTPLPDTALLIFYPTFRKILEDANNEKATFTHLRKQLFSHVERFFVPHLADISPIYAEWFTRAWQDFIIRHAYRTGKQ